MVQRGGFDLALGNMDEMGGIKTLFMCPYRYS